MKKLYKITLASALVAIPTGTTLAVVYGTKGRDKKYQLTSAKSFGENFFDKSMSDSDSAYAAQHLIFAEGGVNLSSLTRIDNIMDSEHAHEFVAKDANGKEMPPIKTVKIQTSNIQNQEGLEAAFLQANKELDAAINTVNEADRTQLGIYIGKDLRTREITASIYRINKLSAEDQATAAEYWNDFGDMTLPGAPGASGHKQWSATDPMDFIQMFGAQASFTPHQLDYFHFNGPLADEPAGWNKYGREYLTPEAWSAAHPDLFKLNDKNSNSKHEMVVNLAKKGLFPTYEPIVDFEKHEMKIVLRMWKLNAQSEAQFFLGDNVYNPVASYSKVIRISLDNIGSTTDIKTTANRATLKHFLASTLPRYLNEHLVKPGLDVLGRTIPSIKVVLDELIKMGTLLSKDFGLTTPEGIAASSVNGYKLKTDGSQPWHDFKYQNILTDEFLDSLLDAISQNSYANGEMIMKTLSEFDSKSFNSDASQNRWTNLERMQKMYHDDGGQFDIYQLSSLSSVVSKTILKEIHRAHPEAKYTQETPIVEKLMNFLKSNHIVADNYKLDDLVANPVGELVKILLNLAKTQTHISERMAREILPLIPVPFISSHVDGFAKMFDYLTRGNNLSEALKFLGKDATEIETNISGLMDAATRWETVERLVSNKNVSVPTIKTIFTALRLTGLVPASLNMLIGDTDAAAGTYSRLFASGGALKIFHLVKDIFEKGIFNMVGTPETIPGITLVASDNSATFSGTDTNAAANKTALINWYKSLDAGGKTVVNKYVTLFDRTKDITFVNDGNSTSTEWHVKPQLYGNDMTSSGVPSLVIPKSVLPSLADLNYKWLKEHDSTQHEIFTKFNQIVDLAMEEHFEAFVNGTTQVNGKNFDYNAFLRMQSTIYPKDSFATQLNDVISEITHVVQVGNIDLNASMITSMIKAVVGLVSNLFKLPLTDQGLYSLLGQMDTRNPQWGGWAQEAQVPGIFSFLGTMVDSLKKYAVWGAGTGDNPDPTKEDFLANIAVTFIKFFKEFISIGIKPRFDAVIAETGASQDIVANYILGNIFGTIFPSGFIKGDATKPANEQVTTAAGVALAKGLLYGFHNEQEVISAINVISPGITETELPSPLDGTIADIITSVFKNGKLFDSSSGITGSIANGLMKDDLIVKLQSLLKNGLFNTSQTDLENLLKAMRTTFSSDSFTSTGIKINVLVTDINIPLAAIGNIRNFAMSLTDDAITHVATGLHNILHSPLKDLTAANVNDIIDFINGLGLLHSPIPHLGHAVHALFNGGLKDLTPLDVSQVLGMLNISNSVKEIILKALYGQNYKATIIADMQPKINAVTIPPKVDLGPNVDVPATQESYSSLEDMFNKAKTTALNFNVPLEEIYKNYDLLLEAKTNVIKYNNVASGILNRLNTQKSEIIHLALPTEVAVTGDATLLGGRTWADISARFAAKLPANVSDLAGKTFAELDTLRKELDAIIAEAVAFNRDATKVNAGESLAITADAIKAVLNKHVQSGKTSVQLNAIIWSEIKALGVVKVWGTKSIYTSASLAGTAAAEISGSTTALPGKTKDLTSKLEGYISGGSTNIFVDVNTLLFTLN